MELRNDLVLSLVQSVPCMTTRGTLFERAFEEYKVTRQVSTGNGGLYVSTVEFGGRVPGGFIRNELGYDGPCGSRLHAMVHQDWLDERHKEAAKAESQYVAAPDISPRPAKAPRETRQSRRAKLDQLALRAGVQAIATQYSVSVGQ